MSPRCNKAATATVARLPATYSTKATVATPKPVKPSVAPVRAAAVAQSQRRNRRSRYKNLVSAAAVKPLRCLEKQQRPDYAISSRARGNTHNGEGLCRKRHRRF